MKYMHIAFITDKNYIHNTLVTIKSLIKSNNLYNIFIYIITTENINNQYFTCLNSKKININIINANNHHKKLSYIHNFKENSICVASTAALIKFELPNILTTLEKVLYLDGDIIIRDDIIEIWETNLGSNILAAVPDSGQIYYKHEYVKKVKCYFNSGVMLLNLKLMRELDISNKLIQTKKKINDSLLMDQNIFNIVLDGRVKFLSLKYNTPCASLVKAYDKWTIEDINKLFNTNYSNKGDIFRDAIIIHYSSKNKPWKTKDVPFIEEWEYYNNELNINLDNKNHLPYVTIIIPVYNSEKYLNECLDSILNQSLKEIEIICIDDGSTDNSKKILYSYKDPRIHIFEQKNSGAGATRNRGINLAKGEFIYFMDSDDILDTNALKYLYSFASYHKLDLILFDGISIFEDNELKEKFSQYITMYKRKEFYSNIQTGFNLFKKMNKVGDFIVGPPFQFLRREFIKENNIKFPEGTTHEDNLFTFLTMTYAIKAFYMNKCFYKRRIHHNSVMTSINYTKHFLGMYETAIGIINFINSHNLNTDDKDAVIFRLNRILISLKKIYFDSINIDSYSNSKKLENLYIEDLYKLINFNKKFIEQLKEEYNFPCDILNN